MVPMNTTLTLNTVSFVTRPPMEPRTSLDTPAEHTSMEVVAESAFIADRPRPELQTSQGILTVFMNDRGKTVKTP